MDFDQLQLSDTPDGYSLILHRTPGGWRVSAQEHDPLAARWRSVLGVECTSWADACEAAYTTLWGWKPGAPA